MSQTITVGIADLNVAKGGDVLITHALGSCVGICLYDGLMKIAGLSHIMLPNSADFSGIDKQGAKYADTAIAMLIRKMELMGAAHARLSAKIAGGAQMFACVNNSFARQRIPIAAEDTGKNYGRTQVFSSLDGSMVIRSVNKGEWRY
ncbi:MAG: chemotaxis protein CheD [Clostridium sp. SCN 57-10]|nr:MAG: chemotaxis protein CheD [Clostridium sp. SCN 57-10]